MTFFVYILQSQSTKRYYCGQTDDLKYRVQQHNDPEHTLTKTTKRLQGPWILVWSKAVENRGEALKFERRIKKRGIARFLRDDGGC